MKLLIVDDEPLARQGLRREISRLPGTVIVGECGTRAEAVTAIVERRPDVVLLDIQLGRGTAFEIIEEIGAEVMPVVIFVTAYDRHAIKAFEVHALDYLLKPVDPERLRDAIDRASMQIAREPRRGSAGRLEAVIDAVGPSPAQGTPLSRLVVRDGERLVFVDAGKVEWVESAGNQVRVHAGGRSYTLRTTMDRLERRLASRGDFIRVRRSALVNIRAVSALERYAKGMYTVRLTSGATVTSSRYHQENLRKLITPA
ncbi:MAG TPA: LytTR family DNA-binding domain-containing protein [Gemmatimonadales bacterium]